MCQNENLATVQCKINFKFIYQKLVRVDLSVPHINHSISKSASIDSGLLMQWRVF